MCGVVGIVYAKNNPRLGRVGSFLLKKLEYRGYDSTGGAFFKNNETVTLKKKVGSPSKVIHELDLEKLSGYKFIGQVRWATYGAVTDENAQPHEVNCRTRLLGAHNGNISNTDSLKEFLSEARHRIISDNDGEMLVHLVEHFYQEQLVLRKNPDRQTRVTDLLQAILRANQKAVGSYAACFAAAECDGIFAVKAGSSLYAGKGTDEDGDFIVVSSDLTSVLAKTRFLIPLVEGQGIYFSADEYFVFSLQDGQRSVPGLKRSKLNITDITLQPKYHFFMEQEIASTMVNLDMMLKYYFSLNWEKPYFSIFECHGQDCKEIVFELLKLYTIFERDKLKDAFLKIVGSSRFEAIAGEINDLQSPGRPNDVPAFFSSDEAQLLRELREFGEEYYPALFTLDLIIIWKKKRKVIRFKDETVAMFQQSFAAGGRVFFIGSGTSYHAALTAGFFFNNLTSLGIVPCNPDLFRSIYINSLRAGDVLVAITQSGETKDLVDILNQVWKKFGKLIRIIAVVNNENSTIPQEKAEFFLPLLCGPEIAVAATKSFSAQLALFYLLAASMKKDASQPQANLEKVTHLIGYTLKTCEEDITEVMLKFFLKPSIHILGTSLIGLAREGALKIREVVLNHAEGYDAAEFKHGPNTILGKSTLYSFMDLENVLSDMADFSRALFHNQAVPEGDRQKVADRFFNWIHDFKFSDFSTEIENDPLLGSGKINCCQDLYRQFREQVNAERYFSNYPLIFVCPPQERDIRITISQIHTHKIRGADVVLIAEENEELKKALEGRPAAMDGYFFKYIKIPRSGDSNIFIFQAAVVLQLLALKMSVAKMKYLNRAHIENHGVHPDVPKNVSKSITVD
ncbi:MAG: SIS domain-containing protein [Acidobacteria bacterium]|nr:SIS domain-containing protein [Acidobacteriota bacterium]MBU4308077.1 SIS domain-containing protein [Acidobacteriota bacterium]MCG2812290.1 SIS domain-containing protein [Candidatus Aminicenantes bacterium]